MGNIYQNVWLKLNELALLKRWSNYYDKSFYNLFNHNEDFTEYTVDLYKFSTLYDRLEGLEFTPKTVKLLFLLGEVIIAAIPEISKQEKPIVITVQKKKDKVNHIYFDKNIKEKFHCD